MFTTGNHLWLYGAGGLYAAAMLLALLRLRRAAMGPLLLGLVAHALYLVGRGWLAGAFYANPIFEGPFFLPWCLAACAAVACARDREIPLAPLIGTVVGFMILAVAYSKGAIPPTPKKITALAAAFFFTENLGYGLFYCGAALAFHGLVRRADDERGHPFLVWGFVVFSLSQIVGALWCWVGWGNTFRFSTRHFTSAAIWIAFAAYVHLRFTPAWGPRRRAVFAVAAAVVAFVATYGNHLREMAFPRVGG
ncbi:MAG: hypothetical protein M0R80_05375 [Proteobacteria bacterium]|nr:hypothetical protein [Pseudomonadota bacterium]